MATGGPQWIGLLVSLAVCLTAGWIGSLVTTPNIPTWYAGLKKPPFNPPNGTFPVVWTILYVLMAVAAWLVWREETPDRMITLLPFAIQIALNIAWSFAFFGARSPLLGLVVITLLLAAILWTMVWFWPVSQIATLLFLPYLAWVAFAVLLNSAIYRLNQVSRRRKP